MNICIDYDQTFTTNPGMWTQIIQAMQAQGAAVWCVTARDEASMSEVRTQLGPFIGATRCIATSGAPKRSHLRDHHNFEIDIWIDDMPETIGEPYTQMTSGLILPFSSAADRRRVQG